MSFELNLDAPAVGINANWREITDEDRAVAAQIAKEMRDFHDRVFAAQHAEIMRRPKKFDGLIYRDIPA